MRELPEKRNPLVESPCSGGKCSNAHFIFRLLRRKISRNNDAGLPPGTGR